LLKWQEPLVICGQIFCKDLQEKDSLGAKESTGNQFLFDVTPNNPSGSVLDLTKLMGENGR
jgi:hypothetical protein